MLILQHFLPQSLRLAEQDQRCGMRTFSAVLVILAALFIPASSALSQRVPSDFNRDGMSELVFVSTNRNLVWAPVDISSGGALSQTSLGVVGDHVIMADWLGSGQPSQLVFAWKAHEHGSVGSCP